MINEPRRMIVHENPKKTIYYEGKNWIIKEFISPDLSTAILIWLEYELEHPKNISEVWRPFVEITNYSVQFMIKNKMVEEIKLPPKALPQIWPDHLLH